jgi:protein phosphatase
MTKLSTATRVDIGRVRENNEDVVVAHDHLVAVADGMGGGPGGEVAASIAIALVQAAFTGRSLDELRAGVRAANRAIWERASASADLEGMGSTICAIGLVEDGTIAVVNVGDSRAYVWRDAELRQLTQDHTVTAELIRRGELTEEAAVNHPHRNVLTRVLGVGPEVDPECSAYAVEPGDRVLVCSDGLCNEVSDQDIASVMAATTSLSATAERLVESALAAGARDNVAVVLADIEGLRDGRRPVSA